MLPGVGGGEALSRLCLRGRGAVRHRLFQEFEGAWRIRVDVDESGIGQRPRFRQVRSDDRLACRQVLVDLHGIHGARDRQVPERHGADVEFRKVTGEDFRRHLRQHADIRDPAQRVPLSPRDAAREALPADVDEGPVRETSRRLRDPVPVQPLREGAEETDDGAGEIAAMIRASRSGEECVIRRVGNQEGVGVAAAMPFVESPAGGHQNGGGLDKGGLEVGVVVAMHGAKRLLVVQTVVNHRPGEDRA